MCFAPSLLTTTLILCSAEEKGNWRTMPISQAWGAKVTCLNWGGEKKKIAPILKMCWFILFITSDSKTVWQLLPGFMLGYNFQLATSDLQDLTLSNKVNTKTLMFSWSGNLQIIQKAPEKEKKNKMCHIRKIRHWFIVINEHTEVTVPCSEVVDCSDGLQGRCALEGVQLWALWDCGARFLPLWVLLGSKTKTSPFCLESLSQGCCK